MLEDVDKQMLKDVHLVAREPVPSSKAIFHDGKQGLLLAALES